MAVALLRNARNLNRLLHFRSFSHIGSPLASLLVSDEFHDRISLQSGIGLANGFQLFPVRHRFRFSTSSPDTPPTAAVTSATDTSNTKSGGGEKAGESKKSGGNGKPIRGGPVSWLSFLLLAVTGAGILYYYDTEKNDTFKVHFYEIGKAVQAVKEGPSAGKAAIGGPFNLIDHDGKKVSEKDYLGKWTLVYFGFTHCPDICPDELQKMAAAVNKIKQKSGIDLVPIFISVDPERDTVEQVREYVKEFHPKLIGLTGTMDEVKKVARSYRAYFMKTAEEDSDYLVDHSIVMYLMDEDMEFVKFFGKNEDVDSLTDGVIREIKQHTKASS